MLSQADSVSLFRQSAPYINAHRGKTFVLLLPGEAIEGDNFASIIHDIALLNSLGVKLVIAHGARPQIDARASRQQLPLRFENSIRITDKQTLACVQDAAGSVRAQIEALLTMGLANSPMHGAHIRVCSGNLVVAQPLGVVDGTDFEYSGKVRRVDVHGIQDHLNDGSIVLLPPLGYSPTGEIFNLTHEEVATVAAIQLKADKLIIFDHALGLTNPQNKLRRTLELKKLASLTAKQKLIVKPVLLDAINHSIDAGVERCHVISHQLDGALLQELFTRDGCGTLISQNHYEQLRPANIDDVGGILQLIEPLEQSGVLVKRSRDLLEAEIDYFQVLERDGMIIGCAALYPFLKDKSGEIACVATHPNYRGKARGERLVEALKSHASELGLRELFVLTTVTGHWFIEQGFQPSDINHLPSSKQQLYNLQRQSKVFVYTI